MVALGKSAADLAACAGLVLAVNADSDGLDLQLLSRLDQRFHLLLPLRALVDAAAQRRR